MSYRIKQHKNEFNTSFEIQKKSILGFWYNPENKNGFVTGFYNTIEEVREQIDRLSSKTTTTIIEY